MYSTDLRKVAVRMHQEQHISFRGIGALLGMAASTIFRWTKRLHPKGWVRTGDRKFSDDMRTFVTEMIRRNPCATHEEIRISVFNVYGVAISRKLVGIVLKRMGFSRKRVRSRLRPPLLDAWKQRRDDFRQQLERVIANDDLLIAIDESGFDQRPKNSLYGYAPRGQQAIVIGPTCASSRHITLLMAICPNASAPVESHQLLEHSVNGDRFAAFVRSLPYNAPATILLDNASIHRTKVVKDAVAARGYSLLFVPPYSPECNPIENIFGIIKQKFYRCRVHPSTQSFDIRDQITEIVDEKANVSNVSNAFRHMVQIVRSENFIQCNV